MQRLDNDAQVNYDILRDCLCEPIVHRNRVHASDVAKRKSRSRRKRLQLGSRPTESCSNDVEEHFDFIDYMTSELFASLPDELQVISFAALKSDEHMAERYSSPMPPATIDSLTTHVPPSIVDSLGTYSLVEPGSEQNFLVPVFQTYVDTATLPPSTYNLAERASACEICERDWVPLTYHHLIPRQVHAKAVKRGWHQKWQLEAVAWLCRACHNFVHKIAGNEELAKDWWTVERLMSREDVQGWAKFMGRVRWKTR